MQWWRGAEHFESFFLKMMAVYLTKVFKFKGQFCERKQTIINIGIRGSKQKVLFKLCKSSYWIWPGASNIYVLFILLLSIISKLSRGLVFLNLKLTIVELGWHGINFPFSDVSDEITVKLLSVTTFLHVWKHWRACFSVFPQKLIVTQYLSRWPVSAVRE